MTLKKIIKKLYALPYVWNFLGPLFRPRGIIVLMYHRIGDEQGFFPGFSVDKFNEQMHWIKNNCNVIHPDNFKDGIKSNNRFRPNVLITFDDGYHCVYKYAYPILEELSLPALVFLATQPADEGGLIWTDKLYYLLHSTSKKIITLPWNKKIISLGGEKERNKQLSEMKRYLKSIENDSRVKYISELENILEVTTLSNLSRQMLSWEEVRESLRTVSYGGHTHTHPIMSKVSDQALEYEISHCRDRIFTETGIYPKSFAYPNGTTSDYSQLCVQLLQKHGYELGYTTTEGYNDESTSLMEINRIPTNAENIEDFVWLISSMGKN